MSLPVNARSFVLLITEQSALSDLESSRCGRNHPLPPALNFKEAFLKCQYRSRRRKDSELIRVSRASNGLAFSHHHFLSSPTGPAPRRLHSSILSQIDGNALARPREKAAPLPPVEEHGKDDITVFRQSIRSLIPPTIPLRMKAGPNTNRRRRSSSSPSSIISFTSSIVSRKLKSPTPTLATMPSEILDGIFQHLLQPELHVLMLSNSNLTEVAAIYMYFQPHFFSTYRYAQFTYIVSHKEHYASMVRVLDLSYITRQGADEQGDLPPQAGWREFKYREHDMYYVRDRISAMRTTTTLSSGVKVTRITNSSHPAPSPFLKSFHRIRDLPIGGICHVLASCKKIKKVNLSRVQIASDFIVASPEHPATADSGLIYVSDVPKSWTWHSSELAPIYADEIVSWLTRLDGLEVVTAKSCLWLTTARVERFLRESGEKLGKVDFRESGMKKEVRWAVKGKRRAVERVAKEVLDNTKLEVRG